MLNKNLFSDIDSFTFFKYLLIGIRYDLASYAMLNSVFIVLSSMPLILISNRWYQQILKWLFIVVNSIMLSANFIDTKFFEFSGKRLTTDVFNSEWLGDDFFTMLPRFFIDYWYILLGFVLFVWVLIKLYPNYNIRNLKLDQSKILHVGRRWMVRTIVIMLFIVGARGGFQLKPINVISAAQYTTPVNMPIVLNSSFTIIKTLGLKKMAYYTSYSDDELKLLYNPVHQYKSESFQHKNVIVIILESFGREYSGLLNDSIGFTPYFDSIQQKGLYFTNCYANGRRSIEALPSILSSIPALMNNPFITSPYTVNEINSIGSVLKSEGYVTSFFHGGKNGTMGFDNFVKLSGIEQYYGLDEYPNKNDYDGGWGVFDEPYWKYFNHELSKMPEPFFAGIFTLSSHHPYTIPDKYKDKFPKGNLVNIESIGYSDYALGEFFKDAQTQPWFNNTLFVLTADHTAQTNGGFYITELGRYAIPMVFYAPGDTNIVGASDRVCSQADIFPSVMQYLGYNKPFVAFGESIFSDSVPHYSASYTSGVHQLICDSIYITSNGKQIINAACVKNNKLIEMYSNDSLPQVVSDVFIFQQAMLQQYYERMLQNRLVITK